jgi:ABC-type multidrug transport system permease subunit
MPNTKQDNGMIVQRERASRKHVAGQTRDKLVWVLTSAVVLFLAGAAVVGLWRGNFEALQHVWSVVAPFVGALVLYYWPSTQS